MFCVVLLFFLLSDLTVTRKLEKEEALRIIMWGFVQFTVTDEQIIHEWRLGGYARAI